MAPNPSLVRLSYLYQTDLPTDSAELLEWLKIAQQTIEENETIISKLLAEKQNLINQLEDLQRKMNDKANSNMKFIKEGEEYFLLIKDLELKDQQNEELNEINRVLERKLNQLTALINKQNQEQEKDKKNIEALQETVQQKEELITNLRKKLSELNKKEQQYRKSRQDLEKINSRLFSGQSQKQLQINKQQAQIDFLKIKNQELNNFQEQLLKEIDLEKKKVEQLQTYLKSNPFDREELLKSELEQTQERLEQIESDLQKKEQIIAQLENKLTENWTPDQLQNINQEFQAVIAKKEKLLAQTSQELKVSNRRYSELLSRYQSEKKENGFPWIKYGMISFIVAGMVLLVIWLKRKFVG